MPPGTPQPTATPWSPRSRLGRTGNEQINGLNNLNVTGTGTPSLVFGDLVITHSLLVRGGFGTLPTLTVGAGAGSGASVSFLDTVNINDMLAAQIQLVTGTGPAANTTLLTFTYGTAYAEILGDSVYPWFGTTRDNGLSAGLGLFATGYSGTVSTALNIQAAVAPAASTTYTFDILSISK